MARDLHPRLPPQSLASLPPPGRRGGAAPPRTRYRTVWISDFHLGTRTCRARRLLRFLDSIECETLYLVGDIIDGWALKKSWYWPSSHSDVVQTLVDLQTETDIQVIYVPGNHDDLLRDYLPIDFAGVEVRREAEHTTVDGRRFLVVHGDELDVTCNQARWMAQVGDYAYRAVTLGNSVVNTARRRLGLSYYPLAGRIKACFKQALAVISDFELNWRQEAERRGFDGVICGHIHTPKAHADDDVEYYNDGDWVESCSALVEHRDGRLEIITTGEPVEQYATASSTKEYAA